MTTNTMMTNTLEILRFVESKFSDQHFDEEIKKYYAKKVR